MSKNHYIAMLPDGSEVSRKTDRKYEYVVLARRCPVEAMFRAKVVPKHVADNFLYDVRELDPASRKYEHRPEALEAMRKNVEESNGDVRVHVQKVLERSVAAVERGIANGYYDRWEVIGWCGRLDLANKLHFATANKAIYRSVISLPVKKIN